MLTLTIFGNKYNVGEEFNKLYQNPKTLKYAIPVGIFIGIKYLCNTSFLNTIILTGATIGAYKINQKYPNIKYIAYNKIKTSTTTIKSVASTIQNLTTRLFFSTRYKKQKEQEKKDNENAQTLNIYLKLSKQKILEAVEKSSENLPSIGALFSHFGLSENQINTLIIIWDTYSSDGTADYKKRLETLIELLPEDKKPLFQKYLKQI